MFDDVDLLSDLIITTKTKTNTVSSKKSSTDMFKPFVSLGTEKHSLNTIEISTTNYNMVNGFKRFDLFVRNFRPIFDRFQSTRSVIQVFCASCFARIANEL